MLHTKHFLPSLPLYTYLAVQVYIYLKAICSLIQKRSNLPTTFYQIILYLCFTAFKIQHVRMSQMLFPPVMTIMYLPLQGIISLLVLPLMHQVAGDYVISDICPSLYSAYAKRLQGKDYSRRSAIWRKFSTTLAWSIQLHILWCTLIFSVISQPKTINNPRPTQTYHWMPEGKRKKCFCWNKKDTLLAFPDGTISGIYYFLQESSQSAHGRHLTLHLLY